MQTCLYNPWEKQAGFTLIELVIVIVILGIIAAIAVPRFADMSGKARISAAQGIASALESGIELARAKAIVEDVSGQSGNNTIDMDGLTVKFNKKLYPVTSGKNGKDGIGSTVKISKPIPKCAAHQCKWMIDGRKECVVIYDAQEGTVKIIDSGC